MNPILTLVPSAARTVNGNGDVLDLLDMVSKAGQRLSPFPPSLLVQLNITARSGTTPTLVLVIEDSVDGGKNWSPVITFASQNSVIVVRSQTGIRGDAYPAGFVWPINASKIRARWTIGGTSPSFTFDVTAALV